MEEINNKHIEHLDTSFNKFDLIVMYRTLHPSTEEYIFFNYTRKI